MQNGKNKDAMCEGLMLSMRDLESVLDNEENAELIGVADSPESFGNRTELGRLRRSLEQYLSKSQALTYIGLVGHFSSGKSSTINTLLGLWNTKAERLVGLHPTDKAVTLITHPKNGESLLGLSDRGDLEVGSTLIDHKLLKNFVIVDTPGSGDPGVFKEMTLDILPICDRIIYFFSAASSLDETDIPTLLKAHRDLPFIPIRFVVTRANEFAKGKEKPITENGFNAESAKRFVAELISRISSAIPGKAAAEENILLIDNLYDYNIDILPKFIFDESNSQSTGLRALHVHKIEYFVLHARAVRNFFIRSIQNKTEAVASRLSTAKHNLRHYQETVLLASSRLSSNWQKNSDKLVHIKNETVEWLGGLVSQSDIPFIVNLESFTLAVEQIRKDFDFWSNSKANTLLTALKEGLAQEARERIGKLLMDVNNTRPDDLVTFIHNFEFSNNKPTNISATELPLSCREALIKLDAIIAAELKDMAQDLNKSLQKVSDSIRNGGLFAKVEAIILESQEHIREMIDSFVKSAEVYRSAILAVNIRELGEKIPMAKKIDDLKTTQLTEERKLAIKAKTIEKMFPGLDDAFRRFKKISNKIFEKVMALSAVCKRMGEFESEPTGQKAISKYILSLERESEYLDFERVIIKIRNDFNDRSIGLLRHLQSAINRVVNEKHAELSERISQLRRQRLERLAGGAGIGMVLGLSAFVTYYRIAGWADWNLLTAVFLAIIVGLSTTAIGLGIVGLTDRTKIEIETVRFDHLDQMKAQVIRIISETKLDDYSFVNAYTGEFRDIIRKRWESLLQKVIHEYIENSYRSYFKKNMELYRKFETIKQVNLKATSDLLDTGLSYYQGYKKSLEILQGTADEVKAEVILPSFMLLDQIHSRLTELSSALKDIKIG